MKKFILAFVCASCGFAQPVDSIGTPEPATVLLMGAGLAGIGFFAWRRNRKR